MLSPPPPPPPPRGTPQGDIPHVIPADWSVSRTISMAFVKDWNKFILAVSPANMKSKQTLISYSSTQQCRFGIQFGWKRTNCPILMGTLTSPKPCLHDCVTFKVIFDAIPPTKPALSKSTQSGSFPTFATLVPEVFASCELENNWDQGKLLQTLRCFTVLCDQVG